MRHLRSGDLLCWLTFWHSDAGYFAAAAAQHRRAGVSPDRVWVLANTPDEVAAATRAGFRASWVHHNCWLDERLFQPLGLPKKYRAVMVTQPAVYKRPSLASEVPGLAIVAGRPFVASGIDLEAIPHALYVTDVASAEVCRIINQSEVGLILSEEEGGCFASSEYLMCGIPVVSTPSRGGRDVFYDADNTLIVEPSAADVARGVAELAARRLDAQQISRRHLKRAGEFRATFVRDVLTVALAEIGCSRKAGEVLSSCFQHKMIGWLRPSEAVRLLRSAGL
jgi:glycosyltransferase involved in cell wall biosynthesis